MKKRINLYAAKQGKTFEVASVPQVCLLENLGVRPGTIVCVQNRYAFGGPVLLKIEDTYSVAVGKDIAVQIDVLEVPAV